MPPLLSLIALLCSLAALVLQTVAVALPNWIVHTDTPATTGLWEACNVREECTSLSDLFGAFQLDTCAFFQTGGVFGIIAVILLLIALVVGVVSLFSDYEFLYIVAGLFSIIAGIAIIVQVVVFTENLSPIPGEEYGYCLYIAIVACVLAFVAGISYLLSKFALFQ